MKKETESEALLDSHRLPFHFSFIQIREKRKGEARESRADNR
jgi:hypothetical protein